MNSTIQPANNFGQGVQALAKNKPESTDKNFGTAVSQAAHDKKIEKNEAVQQPVSVINKKQLNAQILSSSLSFSETIADQPNALLLKAALQGINESLKALGVEETVEETYESGIDTSPEATAERIVSFSVGFLSSYQEQHPELNEKEAMDKFIEVIGGGIEQGFGEAREVLDGLGVLDGTIAEDIDKTYELVQQGLQDFITATLGESQDESPEMDNSEL